MVQSGKAPVIALMNPGGIRADLVENAAGDVTYGAAFTVQPFNNFVVSMDLTGAQVKAILNEQWNGPNDKAATGNKILQVSGLKYQWDTSEADGHRQRSGRRGAGRPRRQPEHGDGAARGRDDVPRRGQQLPVRRR